jgi:HlyD family secretion protein
MKKKKTLIIISAIVILIIILAVLKSKGVIGSDDIQKVTTDFVKRTTIIETVSANGKIQPEKEVKITPYISGEVVELNVKEGDLVEEGKLLARIDPEIYRSNYEKMEASLQSQKASLANARARLAQTKAQFTNAKLSFERNEKLWKQHVISDADFDAAKSQFEVAKAEVKASEESVKASEYQVASAEASLREAKENLTKTAIYAPVGGTVSKLIVEKGERVAGASQFSAGTEMMRIANMNTMEAVVSVNENDIVRVTLGDTTLIEVDAYHNRKFKGIVTEIATSADVTGANADQVTNFEVKIRILKDSYEDLIPEDNPSYSPFRPGMSTAVEIQTEVKPDILAVPIQAVTTRSDSTGRSTKARMDKDMNAGKDSKDGSEKATSEIKEYVFVYDNGIADMKRVKSGIQDNTNIEILEGLEEGEEIIVGPYRAVSRTLKNGEKVEKVSKDKLFKKD